MGRSLKHSLDLYQLKEIKASCYYLLERRGERSEGGKDRQIDRETERQLHRQTETERVAGTVMGDKDREKEKQRHRD